MPEKQDPPTPAALAETLGLTPSEAERALGYEMPADMVFDVADRGEYFAVVTIDGRSFRVAKDAGEPDSKELDPDDGTVRREQLLAAIAGLEKGNPDHWTKSGKPEVRALEAATGLKNLTAAERDTVWAAYQAQPADG